MRLDNNIMDFIDDLYNNIDLKDKDRKLIYLIKLLYIKKETLLNLQFTYESKQFELYKKYKEEYSNITTIVEKEIKNKIDEELLELKFAIKKTESEIIIIEKAISIIQTIMKTYDMI